LVNGIRNPSAKTPKLLYKYEYIPPVGGLMLIRKKRQKIRVGIKARATFSRFITPKIRPPREMPARI
jgi:hypothetical protein